VFSRRLWEVCPKLDTLIGGHILANTLNIPPEHLPLRTLIHTCNVIDGFNPQPLLERYARHAKANLRPLEPGLRGEMRWSETTWEELCTTNPSVVAGGLRSLVRTCESLGYAVLDADGVDAHDFIRLGPSSGSECVLKSAG